MRKPSKRVLVVSLILALLVIVPGVAWLSLTHEPTFYREAVTIPPARREAEAKRFVAQSLQLRNDICNEPRWEAVFSDQEVNAWLAEDLVTHFADQLPPEVHEPRVVFEDDRVTLAFQLDQGPVKSVIWVVARPRVPSGNVLELTLEKIRAGALPVPADKILDRIVEHARARGLEVEWKRVEDLPVVTARYQPDSGRDDVSLERVEIRKGQILLAGRSNKARGAALVPRLPTRKVLQLRFPRRKIQVRDGVSTRPASTRRSSAAPTS